MITRAHSSGLMWLKSHTLLDMPTIWESYLPCSISHTRIKGTMNTGWHGLTSCSTRYECLNGYDGYRIWLQPSQFLPSKRFSGWPWTRSMELNIQPCWEHSAIFTWSSTSLSTLQLWCASSSQCSLGEPRWSECSCQPAFCDHFTDWPTVLTSFMAWSSCGTCSPESSRFCWATKFWYTSSSLSCSLASWLLSPFHYS